MKLTYDILWFEDQFEILNPTIERLEQVIRSKGVIPTIEKRDKVSQEEIVKLADMLDNNNPYDLIIFDYDMGEQSLGGIEIARALRSHIYTDMVFYSGKKPAEVSNSIFQNSIQGVFVVYKSNLIDDVVPIIEDQIKKYSSLNGARGLMMSETSQIDIELRKLALKILVSTPDEEQLIHIEKIKERIREKSAIRDGKLNKLLLQELISNSIIMDNDVLRKTCKDLCGSKLFDENGVFQTIQQERNFLAHNPHELLSDGNILITSPKRSMTYNHKEFERIRRELIELKIALGELDE